MVDNHYLLWWVIMQTVVDYHVVLVVILHYCGRLLCLCVIMLFLVYVWSLSDPPWHHSMKFFTFLLVVHFGHDFHISFHRVLYKTLSTSCSMQYSLLQNEV